MRVGTKSVLFGAHCFLVHPWFVALAWWRLFGFPWDPRLWVAFFVHDLGYLGKPNMDGPEGERHPELGAKIMRIFDGLPYRYDHAEERVGPLMSHLFDFWVKLRDGWEYVGFRDGVATMRRPRYRWSDFALLHSRYYAKTLGLPPSKLCFADKLAFALTPRWLYLPMARATGELAEYLKNARTKESTHWAGDDYAPQEWHAELCRYMREWVEAHKGGAKDTWTRRRTAAGAVVLLAVAAAALTITGCSQKPELPSQSATVWPAGSEGMRPCATPAAGVIVEPGQLLVAAGQVVPLCAGLLDGRVDGRVLTVGEKKKKARHGELEMEMDWSDSPKTWVEPTTIVEMDGSPDHLPNDVAQESAIQSFERQAREHMLPYEVDWWKADSCQGGICRVIVSVTANNIACDTPPAPLTYYEQTDLAVNISESGGGQTKAFECVYPEPKMESPLPAELVVQRDRQQNGSTTFVAVEVDRPLFPGTSSGQVAKPVKATAPEHDFADFEPAPSHLIHNPYYPPTAGEWTSYMLIDRNSRVILLGKEDADLLDSLSEWAPREDADGASGPEVIKDVERYIAVKNGVDLHPGCSFSELPVQLDGSRYCPDQKPDTYWFSGHLLVVNIPAEAAR